jgi:hypothetical protein
VPKAWNEGKSISDDVEVCSLFVFVSSFVSVVKLFVKVVDGFRSRCRCAGRYWVVTKGIEEE